MADLLWLELQALAGDEGTRNMSGESLHLKPMSRHLSQNGHVNGCQSQRIGISTMGVFSLGLEAP